MAQANFSASKNPCVLVVDDSLTNLGVAEAHLLNHGYKVLVARDGEEGLQRARFAQPDIVLLDVMMPGENGFEICRRLKSDPDTEDIPVIFMTSLDAENDKLTGFEAGGVDYITKPLRIAEMLARVDTHVKLRLMHKQLAEQNRLLQNHRQELARQVAERTAKLIAKSRLLEEEVGERQKAQIALQESERQYRSLVENIPDTVARYDLNCRRTFANLKTIEELGGNVEAVLNRTPTEFPGGKSASTYQEIIRQVAADGRPQNFELTWDTDEGRQIVSYIRLTPEFDAEGKVASVLAVGRDITEIDQYRRSIHRLAFYDVLTDLPNRALLVDRIKQTMNEAGQYGYRFGLILLDLDRFKEVNDTLGHRIGDQLLCAAAERLLETVRSSDTLSRLGGDEFAILMPEVKTLDDIAVMADGILKAFERPFQVSGREMFISASLGIAVYPTDSADIDFLFRYADSAMYHAKNLGRNNFQFYARELTARAGERLAMEAALRHARVNGELELYYQPQIELSTGRLIGTEALLRWHRGGEGLVSPDKFIPIAEESGLIVSIGEWVLKTACDAAVVWNSGRLTEFKVAVNLSTRQFLQNDLLATVENVLTETGCRPEWLKLEITESLLLDDSNKILEVLNGFDAMGLALSIDDFGTGYSSLSYLNRFPVSQIKIDRSFVSDIPDAQDKAELVKAMISIAQALNLELVAEGVETPEQADYLRSHGCQAAQGYWFGKPMPLNEFEAWLANRS